MNQKWTGWWRWSWWGATLAQGFGVLLALVALVLQLNWFVSGERTADSYEPYALTSIVLALVGIAFLILGLSLKQCSWSCYGCCEEECSDEGSPNVRVGWPSAKA